MQLYILLRTLISSHFFSSFPSLTFDHTKSLVAPPPSTPRPPPTTAMAQAVMYREQPKELDNMVDNVVSSIEAVNINDDSLKKNRIQVSNTKKPLFFYLNLAKRYMKQHDNVELSALGMAIPTLVTIVEILKANGVAVEKKVLTSTVGSKDETKNRVVQKAKLEIVLEKKENSGNQKSSAETDSDNSNTETKAVSGEAKSVTNAAAGDSKTETKSTAASVAEKKDG